MTFTKDVLKLDAAKETNRITGAIRSQLQMLKRKGAVLGLSGGIDSSVTAALCAKAVGADHVFGVMMPETDSAGDTVDYSSMIGKHFGIESVLENITPILEAAGCYRRRDEAIKSVIPEYTPEYKCKIVLPSVLDGQAFRIFSVVVQSPEGKQTKARLPLPAYLTIVAATNFKQRARKMLEYYHADRLNYAVAGTPNRLEYDQGFFVKNGDGAADIKPIAHLYKTQVYQLAEYLDVPAAIRNRPPTTDTYSLEQSQDEFYFSVPHREMDLCLYGKDHGVAPADVAPVVGLKPEQVERVYKDIDAKRAATKYQHAHPLLVEKVIDVLE